MAVSSKKDQIAALYFTMSDIPSLYPTYESHVSSISLSTFIIATLVFIICSMSCPSFGSNKFEK